MILGGAKKNRKDALRPGMNKQIILEPKNGGGWEDELLFQLGEFLGEPAVNAPRMYTNKV